GNQPETVFTGLGRLAGVTVTTDCVAHLHLLLHLHLHLHTTPATTPARQLPSSPNASTGYGTDSRPDSLAIPMCPCRQQLRTAPSRTRPRTSKPGPSSASSAVYEGPQAVGGCPQKCS
ncbi:hypothetical protein Vafri_5671, partial [Volvox africanus]